MIKLSKNKVFNSQFILKYKKLVQSFVLKKNIGFTFFHHSFKSNDIIINDLINRIAYDPFSFDNLNDKYQSFLNDYYEISQFLLHGSDYLKIIKIQFNKKSGLGYKKNLIDKRKSIIDSFKKNKILITLGINDPKIIKTEKSFLIFHKHVRNKFNDNNEKIRKIFDYNDFLRFQKNIRNEILENNEIKVCPYCNRQYIDTYSYQGKIKSIAQIDHLFPKSVFPLYSLTLLNFIPSCSYCNCIIKSDKLFPWPSIYVDMPSDKKYFEISYRSISGIFGNTNDFDLKITPNDTLEKNNSYFFRHKEIYESHKEDISMLLKKRQIFHNGYKKSIENIIKNDGISNEEFSLMIFGVTGNESDYLTTPLSKLKNDILKDFK